MVLRVKNFLNLKKKKKGQGEKVKEKRKIFSSREKKNYKNIVTFKKCKDIKYLCSNLLFFIK